jgi:hypothetical protein
MPKNYRLMSPAEKRAAAGLLREAHLLLEGMGIPAQPGLREGYDRLMDEWRDGLPTLNAQRHREEIKAAILTTLNGEMSTSPSEVGEDLHRAAQKRDYR